MPISAEQHVALQKFFNQSNFRKKGGVITDLDGTAIHEFDGQIVIPKEVEFGLKKIHDLGRPVIINSLRFPLSVMRTFGRDWYSISNSPIPTVLMNGSQLGYITDNNGKLVYEEIDAFPLTTPEINEILRGIERLVIDKITDLLVFYYPRDWKQGEIVWTPVQEKISHVQQKYLSATLVYSSEVAKLESDMNRQEICMIFLLIEVSQDKLMAYQHSKKNNFFTRKGVDKLFGMEQIASKLGFDLMHSIGAGDTPMDSFLKGVGLAVHVGRFDLELNGIKQTIKLSNSSDLGDLFFSLAEMQLDQT